MFEEGLTDEALEGYISGDGIYRGHYQHNFARNLEITFHVRNKRLETLECCAFLENTGESSFIGSGNALQWSSRLGLHHAVSLILEKGVM